MSSANDSQPVQEEECRSRDVKSSKEKKRRRRSRSKQKETPEAPVTEGELPAEEDGNNSNSSTPIYERSDDSIYPVGGTRCAFCYCGEKSLLGQGDLTRYSPSSGFNPFKKPPLRARGSREMLYGSSPGSSGSQDNYLNMEKVTKTAAQRRGSKQMRETMKAVPKPNEYVDELSTVGSSEVLDVGLVFEPSGHVTAHHCCAAWSEGVTQNESYNLLCVDKAVHAGMSQRCHSCSRYGATIKCRAPKCERLFHYPCAAGSGCFQDIKSMSLLCTDHLELASTIADPDELNCAVCDSPGQISDLLFCTSCGHHYHGDCLYPHVDVNPMVRAGWQCPECKICQTCRQPGDDNKMLVCDACDKGYHTFCLRPAMTFIPKNGWCCKMCRRCTDCGSRTPGNGPSSRWHINYQVCDKCYQLRNKGHSCPVCSKAYRNIPASRVEMGLCTSCNKYVHWTCEEEIYLDACQNASDDYKCPPCRNPPAMAVSDVIMAELSPQPAPPEATAPAAEEPVPPPLPEPAKDAEPKEPAAPVEVIARPPTPTNVCAATRKRASTSSSVGSDKGGCALKGSSLDPMLSVGDNSNDPSGFVRDAEMSSPPPKIRHLSLEESSTPKNKTMSQASADGNLGNLFHDDNAQDAISLFGMDSLPQSSTKPTTMLSPTATPVTEDEKAPVPDDISPMDFPKIATSPVRSPSIYDTPVMKPPGPGIGKPGAMFGRGKPFGHKKKPATAKSRGKGKGKGHKRGSLSGPRKRPRGGKGSAAYSPSERIAPRRARRSFNKQPSLSPAIMEEGLPPASILTRTEPVVPIAREEEYGDSMHNTVVICSTDDKFTLTQDMCVVCGSFGKDSEGRLVSCSQCGQCYHPYCVGLKLSKVVLRKGWRCLDCTVCEECGQVDDPAHLLLCDDCDISYHTHCLKPPLLHVPKGGWKCKWCVRCVHCGSTSPGKNCEWQSNYQSCGPCASANQCPKCRRSYRDEDIIMQCGTCDRWVHSSCESLFSEADIEKVLEMGYECFGCRPKDATPPHLVLAAQSNDQEHGNFYMGRTRYEVDNVKEYHKDFTALTIKGLQHIQKLMQKHMGLLKKRPQPARGRSRKPSDVQDKLDPPPPVLPTLEGIKSKQALGQPINVADAVKALQEPSEVYGKLAELMDTTPVQTRGGEVAPAGIMDTQESTIEGAEKSTPSNAEGLKSPQVDVESVPPKCDEPGAGMASPDPTKAALGIADGGVKKRRKPYRPGIGGFMVRSRGRGGFLKPRSRRTVSQTAAKAPGQDSKNDQNSTVPGNEPALPAPDPSLNQAGDVENSNVADPVKSGIPPATVTVEDLVNPVKLKVPVTAAPAAKHRKKKRMKLIDQFPIYLQDAFFGKEVMGVAEAKSNPLDELNEAPVSAISSKQNSDSRLVLPDRITQRLVAQAAHQTNAGAFKSQRGTNQPQDEDAIMMDRENEQELLGVLPDLPFKDDDLLGMISSELKQDQGPGESHDHILSPSSLEKMVRDGFDESDMAALFSDVLSHQTDNASTHGHVPETLTRTVGQSVKQPQKSHPVMQQENRPQPASHTPMEIQQESVPTSDEQRQRQLAIQMELQQIEMKQHPQMVRQRQHDVIPRQLGVNTPQPGYGVAQQPEQNIQPNMANIEHGRPMCAQPGPPQRQQSVPVSPAMMGGSQHAVSFNQMKHSGRSPHPTPPPMFARQASVPAGIPSQTPVQADVMSARMMNAGVTSQSMVGKPAHPKGIARDQSMIGGLPTTLPDSSLASNLYQGFRGNETVHGPVPVSMKPTCVTTPSQTRHDSMTKTAALSMSQPASGLQMSTQHPNVAGQQGPYLTSTTPLTQPSVSPGSATHKRSSSVPIIGQNEPGVQNVQMQAVTPEASDRPVSSQLPNFSSDPVIFEPSPRPWPFGTDLDADSQSMNQRNVLKWEKDEQYGELATISPVLYANVKYPELKTEYPDWTTRARHISKLWRKTTPEERAPFLSKAKDNRSLLKTSRTRKSESSKTPTPPVPSETPEMKPSAAGTMENPSRPDASMTESSSQLNAVTFESTAITSNATIGLGYSSSATPLCSASSHVEAKPSATTTATVSESPSKLQTPACALQPKTERVTSDAPTSASGPFPQTKPSMLAPKLEDTPTKSPAAAGVTRSKSLGTSLGEQGSQKSSEDVAKIRRLSVDSQVQQASVSRDADTKPTMSLPSSVVHQSTPQRNARRARLWEQSQNHPPPPPYPSVSGGAIQTVQGMMYPPMGARGQVMTIGQTIGPGGTILCATSPAMHNAGMLRFPFEAVSQQGMMPAHVMQQHPFPPGTMPMTYRSQHPPGAYIELRHTNESDPAVRRQNILRMMGPQNAAQPEPPASLPQTVAKEVTLVVTSAPVDIKAEVETQPTVAAADLKAQDPFAGGLMPQDEHLDALLRSDEFKDLHFQGEQNVSSGPSPIPSGSGESITTQAAITASTTATISSKSSEKQPTATAISQDVSTEPCKRDDGEKAATSSQIEEKISDVASSSKSDAESNKQDTGTVSESVRESNSSEHEDKGDSVKEKVPASDGKLDSGKEKVVPINETSTKSTEKDAVEKEIDQLDHCYSRSAKDDGKTNDAMTKALAKLPSPIPIGDNADSTQPRGVGLTPPPVAEVPFLPSIEEKKPDSTSPLTVSNVITLPPSPPVLRSRIESPKETVAEENKSLEVDSDLGNTNNVLEKDADMAVYPKSPEASPVAQNLSKFAKVPENTKADVAETLVADENTKPEISEKSEAEKNNAGLNEAQTTRDEADDRKDQPMETEDGVGMENVSKQNEGGAAVAGAQFHGEDPDKSIEDKSEQSKNAEEIVRPMEVVENDESRHENAKKLMDVKTTADSVLPGVVCTGASAEQPSPQLATAVTSSVIVPRTTVTEGQDASSVAQTITVIHTSIATVTACKVPAPRTAQAAAASNVALTQANYTQIVSLPCVTAQGPMPVAVSTVSSVAQTAVTDTASVDTHTAAQMTGGVSQDDGTKGTGAQKQWPLLIKEQPLILQELLDQEKREQEKARREKMMQSQSMIPPQGAGPPGVPGVYNVPGVDVDKVPTDSGIDTIKMEFLSRMNEAAKAGLAGPAAKSAIIQPGAGPAHVQQQAWLASPVAGAVIQQTGAVHTGGDTDVGKYRAWLIQQQHLFQIQIPKQEQLMQTKKTRKQSLMKKRNLCKKNGKEFSLEDAEELKIVAKQYTDAQHGLEKLRNDYKQHAELMSDFNMRQRHLMESMTGIVQQNPQVAATLDGTQQQQSLLIQHAAAPALQQKPAQQIMMPQFQGGALQQAVPQQQIVMMQPRGPQQVIIKSMPGAANVSGPMPVAAQSPALDMQQQGQVVVPSQVPQPGQPMMAQFQKMPGLRDANPGQIQQVHIAHHPQPQLQMMQPQQHPPSQTSPQFRKPPGKEQAVTSTNTTETPAQTPHDDLMQMQMQQLMALQMEQQQQMAAQQNPDKPKPKRKRKKKKTQAEKEGEEKLARVTQQMQQVQYVHQAPGMQQQLHRPMTPNMTQQHHMMAPQTRFASPQMQIPAQPPTPTSTPTLMGPPSRPPTPLSFPPASTPMGHIMTSPQMMSPVSGSHMMAVGPQSFHNVMTIQGSNIIASGGAVLHSGGATVQTVSPVTALSSQGSANSNLVPSQRLLHTGMLVHAPGAMSSQSFAFSSNVPVSMKDTVSNMKTETPVVTPLEQRLMQMSRDMQSTVRASTSVGNIQLQTNPGTPTMPPAAAHTTPHSGRSTPRNQSPRLSMANFDGLSEAEIAIIMAHDPDLSDRTVSSTPVSTLSTPPHQTAGLDQDEKGVDGRTKKKKGYGIDSKTMHTIEDSIEKVVRLSSEYDDRLQAAKLDGTHVTQSPWELNPKPTKFPTRKMPEPQQMVMTQDGVRCILNHPQYASTGMMTPEMMAHTQKSIAMGMMPYTMTLPDMDTDLGQKKKKVRRPSKEVGPDGKPVKRKKKKDKNVMQAPFQIGGKPGVMTPAVPFPGGIVTSVPPGHISPGQPVVGGINKAVAQWKPTQLTLLRLSEPPIRRSHHICVPEGTGVTNCKNLQMGLLAESTYSNIPDFYELILDLKKRLQQPSSSVKLFDVAGGSLATIRTTAETAPVPPSASTSRPDQTKRYGPLGLSPDGNAAQATSVHSGVQSQVKVPESMPTPPHQGIDDRDDMVKPRRVADDTVISPSSPEMDNEDDWDHRALATLRADNFSLMMDAAEIKSEKVRDCPSPTIPLMQHPKISVPYARRYLDDKDSVSVTVEFDNANLKSIEKSLTLLSRILEAPIFSFNVVEVLKPGKELKESLNRSVKEEQTAIAAPPTSQSSQLTSAQQDGGPGQVMQEQKRCCLFCKTLVKKNGVRMPKFDGSAYEEDEIFCNKDCFIKYEFQEKKVTSTTTKKKFKASHIYQRHTQKISMQSLLDQCPDEDGLPSKNTRSSVESIYFPSGVLDVTKAMPPAGRGRGRRRVDDTKVISKRWKGIKWKKWSPSVAIVKPSAKPAVDMEPLFQKYGSALKPPATAVDKRTCVFCGVRGDGNTDSVARLLNVDVDRWVHLNCALWSAEVYETQGGALINVDLAWRRSESVLCCLCQKKGATIHCHRPRCVNTYHCQCAIDVKCVFFKDKTVLCPTHAPKPGVGIAAAGPGVHQSGDTLRSLAVFRKVYVQRPETKQIASIMQQGELTQGEKNYVLRVGALIFENVGQLATQQMANCHSSTAIYPLGYRATRMFWSRTNMRRRCRYQCSITEVNGKPSFKMMFKAALPGKNKPDKIVTHADTDTKMEIDNVNDLWMEILGPLEKLRSQHSVLKLFPAHITGEKLFGLTIPVVSRVLESLPNIELCSDYKFRYGRTPLLEVPLAINPTGCARSEPHIKQHRKKPHTLISNLISEYYESSGIGDASSLYGKQFVHSKSSQYRKMKNDWRSNVYLARSRIQGLGLYSARDIEPGTMVIEYIGDIIRTEVSEKREKMYEESNRGVYMFRLDSDHIVDATVTGGPARYINHSCKPNCVAEVVNFEKEKKIMIVSNRHILKGEELSYDYKFDFEDEGRKIPCLCGASNCKKWMN